MISLTLEQTHTVIEEDGVVKYQLDNEIVASDGITLACFVFEVGTDEFHHPATVIDLEAFPESKAEALALGLEYYRQASATKKYTSLIEACDGAAVIRSRLAALPGEQERVQEDFSGTQTYTYTSGN